MTAYDCLVVGARCAGSTLARFLAQRGKRVLMVDAGTFPSDQPMSTHFIHGFGVRILDELGLGDRLREIAPPIMRLHNGCAGTLVPLDVEFGACCPRRIDLDALLVEGAREAGVEIQLHTRLVELVKEKDRVVGAVLEDKTGRTEVRASIVVGADGRSSTVAELAGAEKYLAYEAPRSGYWAYWPRPSWYSSDERYRGGSFVLYDDQDVRFVFPTNRDQILVGVTFPREELAVWKADPDARLRAKLAAHSITAPIVEGANPLGKLIGVVKIECFFRRAAGPGWALVGDAGLHKDPHPGFGISDALRDARALAAAIASDGGDAAIERYWRQRDVESIELYNFARDTGALTYDNALNRLMYSKLAAHPELRQRIIDIIERRVSPYEAFKVSEVLGWTFGALLRGNFRVLGPFFAAGKVGGAVKRELRRRRALLVPALPPPS